ncbi:anaphase-promoting complex subunit 6-like [Dorcoceras hygrometricum]|uniref:Anaphase-promoting complex subunit 6-like n=1 Tax=Dorcoceras hygrometricum TaxID=472368 RepID=A0A2Z7C4K3_9LAMI|nr:anaphase-promoting complex subunit 6-like [Dorcoceras hygrometricum]
MATILHYWHIFSLGRSFTGCRKKSLPKLLLGKKGAEKDDEIESFHLNTDLSKIKDNKTTTTKNIAETQAFDKHSHIATGSDATSNLLKRRLTCTKKARIQLAVSPQPLWLRNHNFGLAQRIMVKRLAKSPHDPLGITDSACKNQLVVVSVHYGPFNTYIPIKSTTIDNIGYPRMKASGESSTTKHRLLHASGPHPIPPPNDPKTNQYNQDHGLIHSTNGNHLESPNEDLNTDLSKIKDNKTTTTKNIAETQAFDKHSHIATGSDATSNLLKRRLTCTKKARKNSYPTINIFRQTYGSKVLPISPVALDRMTTDIGYNMKDYRYWETKVTVNRYISRGTMNKAVNRYLSGNNSKVVNRYLSGNNSKAVNRYLSGNNSKVVNRYHPIGNEQ